MGYIQNVRKTIKFKHFISLIGVAAALIVMVILNQTGALSRSTLNLLPRIGYSVILAVSLNLVVGFLGELSLGHAGFMCVGAYLGTKLSLYLHTFIPSKIACLFIAMILGGLIAAFFGFLIGLPALRLKGDYLAIVTLAFGEIVRNVFKNLPNFGEALGLNTSAVSVPNKELFVIVFLVLLVVLALIQNLMRSKHGRAITAIRDNEIAARAMGINVTFYKLLVFIVAAFFAGVAGVIYGHCVSPIRYSAFDYNYSIEILVMVVLGGIGSINGSIIAATVITVINAFLQDKLSGDLAALRLLVYAIILIAIIIFNNAPALKPIKERLDLKGVFKRLFRKKDKPEVIKDDEAAWNRVPTKINMDELLSVDVKNKSSRLPSDKPEKGDRHV